VCRKRQGRATENISVVRSCSLWSLFEVHENEDNAKDVFQEAFVIAYQKMYQFKFEGSFEGWLKRIFIYKCIETLKKNRKTFFY